MKVTSFPCQVRTAPSPSQSPTPFAEGGKLLPGEVRAPLRVEKREEGAKVAMSVVGEEKLVEATEQKQNLAADEDREKEATKEQEQEYEQGSGPVPDLVPQSEQQEHESATDSLKDRDIVAVSEAQCCDAASRGDNPDVLNMRAGSPEDALASPPDTTAGSPDALHGPPDMPDTPPESPYTVSLPEAPSSEPGSPQTQVRTRLLHSTAFPPHVWASVF